MENRSLFFASCVIAGGFAAGMLFVATSKPKERATIVNGTPVPYGRSDETNGALVTVEHDGHKFVVHSAVHKTALLHHPSCPCGQR